VSGSARVRARAKATRRWALVIGGAAVVGATVAVAVAAGCCRSSSQGRGTTPAGPGTAGPVGPGTAGPATAGPAGQGTAGQGASASGLTAAPPALDTNAGAGTEGAVEAATAARCSLAPLAWRFPAQPRVIALGDLHGDLAAARRALVLAGVLDEHDHWRGGTTWVVQTGDLLDRGDDEQAIIDLFERLEREADAAGGRLVWLLGNHELMNAAGDLRYVTRGGFRDFEDVPALPLERFANVPAPARARVAAFAPGGPYARILAGQTVVAVVGDTAFVHGGIVPGVAAELDDAQHAMRCWLDGQGPPPALLERDDGPVWDRSFATNDLDCLRLHVVLRELQVKRMVVGHTVQPMITSACDEQIFRIDVGMSAYYGGPTEVLELTPRGARILGRGP
jgi:hypothetical protein